MTKSVKKVLITVLSAMLALTIFVLGYIPTEKGLAEGSFLTLTNGASCRIVVDDSDGLTNSGLKFEAKLEKTEYDALVANYEKVEAGIIIVPEDYVVAAGGYTLDKLEALSVLNGKTFYKITETFKDGGTHYLFYNSIITIKPTNYNRNFTAASFVKVVESDVDKVATLTDFTEYNGAYYLYSNSHTANVYDVAYAAYEDRIEEETDGYFEIEAGSGLYGKLDSEGYEVLKRYLDGVAVISAENGVATIANNDGKYYKSPYSLGVTQDGFSFVSKKPVALTYNKVREKDLSKVDYVNDVKLYSDMQSSGATFNASGAVSLDNRYPTGGIGWLSGISKTLDNSYIAFEGKHGVGTYVDFTFVGNNMPQVAFFANEINGDMSCGNASSADFTANGAKYNGYIIMNGLYGKTASGTQVNYGDRLLCMGPYRMHTGVAYNEGSTNISKVNITSLKEEFTQNYLSTDTSGIVYKYVAGTFVQSGTVYFDLALYNATTGSLIESATYDTGKTETEVEALGGNIIAYGCVKGGTEPTTFTYSAPYRLENADVKVSGARFNYDGTVSLDNRYPTGGIGWLSGVSKTLDNSYIAFEGKHGVGTYVDFTFVGNNMPQVAFFANEINGDMSCGNASSADFTANGAKYNGYIIMNGLYGKTASGTQVNYGDRLLCMGPYRMHTGVTYNEGITNISKVTITSLKEEFTQNYLSTDTSGIVYKYVAGTFVQSGTVYFDLALYNATTGALIQSATYDTGKTETEVEALGGNIIAYGCVKGGTEPTTFTYSAPYVK